MHPLCLPLFLDDRFKYNSGTRLYRGMLGEFLIRSWDRVSLQVDGEGGGSPLQGVQFGRNDV